MAVGFVMSEREGIVRSLSFIETLMANDHACRQGTSQFVTLLHFRAHLEPERVEEAYRQICRDDAVLSSSLRCVEGRWVLAPLPEAQEPSFFYESHDERGDERDEVLDASDQRLEAEINDILDPKRGIIRLRMLSSHKRDEHIWMLTLHHGVADAFTAKRLLGILLRQTALPPRHSRGKNASDSVHQPFEGEKLPEKWASPYGEDFTAALEATAPRLGAYRTAVRTVCFSAEEVAALAYHAQQADVSLNSLLTAMSARAMQRFLGVSTMRTLTGVSMRGRVSPTLDVGCIIDVADITLGDDKVEEEARSFHRQLHAMRKEMEQKANRPDLSVTAEDHPGPFSRDDAIKNCQGAGFTNNGQVEKVLSLAGVDILSYRSVANRNASNLLPVFHCAFLNKSLAVSLALPALLVGPTEQDRLAALTQQVIRQSLVS